eukprot:88178-Hanusia_phi.AAC.1
MPGYDRHNTTQPCRDQLQLSRTHHSDPPDSPRSRPSPSRVTSSQSLRLLHGSPCFPCLLSPPSASILPNTCTH